MKNYRFYENMADDFIKESKILKSPTDRVGKPVLDLLAGDFCVDVHTHFFDMRCINEAYFLLRNLKDFLKIRGEDESGEEALQKLIYTQVDKYNDDWNEKLANVVDAEETKRGGVKSILTKLLWMKKTKQVYEYYLKDASLARYFDYPKENVLTTILMMDFRHGWGANMSKSIFEQIEELVEMREEYPVLPFLFCDPRRADETDEEENLYYLFNKAFANDKPLFGVKIYPSLGYDPDDYRLWPIYKVCEKLQIPVLTHCGGARVAYDKPEVMIFEGEKQVELKFKTHIEVGCELTNPKRWKPVLEKFPNLRLDIAHFGSNTTWAPDVKPVDCELPQKRKETIFALMKEYDHVYSDFSYTITSEEATLKFVEQIIQVAEVRERSMFGSDYWVVFDKGSLEKNQKKFLDIVAEKDEAVHLGLVDLLCKTNPIQYLFGKQPPF